MKEGWTHSEVAKAIISARRTGKKWSQDVKDKMAEGHRGKVQSEATKAKIRATLLRRKEEERLAKEKLELEKNLEGQEAV